MIIFHSHNLSFLFHPKYLCTKKTNTKIQRYGEARYNLKILKKTKNMLEGVASQGKYK